MRIQIEAHAGELGVQDPSQAPQNVQRLRRQKHLTQPDVGPLRFQDGSQSLTLNAWHQDQVTRRPESAQVLAGNDFCENAVLAYGDTIWTVQPHPEYGAKFIDGLIRTRGRGLVPDTILDDAAANLAGPTNNTDIAAFIAAFLKKERA